MQKYFLMSDIHGMYDLMKTTLRNWEREEETLVLLGDLMDKGPDSKSVLLELYKLSKSFKVLYIRGNHEDLLLSFLKEPEAIVALYYGSGGRETLQSFFGNDVDTKTPTFLANRFKVEYKEIVEWMQSSIPYYEDVGKNYTNVFVHAGVDLQLSDWRTTQEPDFYWIREDFIYGHNPHLNTRFYFGHTPTYYINEDESTNAYITKDNKIGIDGGAYSKGNLIGVKVTGKEYSLFGN